MTNAIPVDRFNAKISIKDDGCWLWTGSRKAAGYGNFLATPGGRTEIAHRWSYANFVAPIPVGYEVDHLCRNRSCVNPEHLEAVTLQENRRRRNAAKTHCVNGHKYTPESTYEWTDPQGYTSRRCRICNTQAARRSRLGLAA